MLLFGKRFLKTSEAKQNKEQVYFPCLAYTAPQRQVKVRQTKFKTNCLSKMSDFSNIIHLNSLLHDLSSEFLKKELLLAGYADLEPCHGDLFFVLFEKKSLPLTELAACCGRSKSTISVMVNNLVKKGYLLKNKDPQCARTLKIALSTKGLKLEKVFISISTKMQSLINASLNEEEQHKLECVLGSLLNSFKINLNNN